MRNKYKRNIYFYNVIAGEAWKIPGTSLRAKLHCHCEERRRFLRFARNRLCNLIKKVEIATLPLVARNDREKGRDEKCKNTSY